MFFSISNAQKLVKRLQTQQNRLEVLEKNASVYSYFEGETVTVPEYSFSKTMEQVEKIANVITEIKHLIRVENVKNTIPSGITVDEAIVQMAFLTKQKDKLERMVNRNKKTIDKTSAYSGGTATKYTAVNYSLEEVNQKYNEVCTRILRLQDEINQFNVMHQIKISMDEDEINKLFTVLM